MAIETVSPVDEASVTVTDNTSPSAEGDVDCSVPGKETEQGDDSFDADVIERVETANATYAHVSEQDGDREGWVSLTE